MPPTVWGIFCWRVLKVSPCGGKKNSRVVIAFIKKKVGCHWCIQRLVVSCSASHIKHTTCHCLFLFWSLVLLPSVLVVLVVLLHQDSDQQHGDHPHLSGPFLLPPPWVQNTQQVFTHHSSWPFLIFLMNLIFKNRLFTDTFLMFFQQKIFDPCGLGCHRPTDGPDCLVSSADVPFLAGR